VAKPGLWKIRGINNILTCFHGMKELSRERLFLFILLSVFIVLKIPHLFYPFYWDESWPYASAITQMFERGPTMLPGVLDSDLSRGHPLLFHFLTASWMKLFGGSHAAMHSFPLLVSIVFIIAVYEVGLRLFSKRVAVIASVLIAFQQIFFVQAAMLLPELLLALTGFLSIYFYAARKYIATAICLTLLFYTKESGMVLGAVLGLDAFINLFRKDEAKQKLLRLACVAVPFLLVGAFFLLQKKISGWYFFPLHTSTIEHDWTHFYNKFRESIKIVFRNDRRNYYFLFVVLCSVIIALKSRQKLYFIPVLAAAITFLAASDKYHSLLPDVLLMLLFAWGFITAFFAIASGCERQEQRTFIRLSGVFIVLFIAFTALNFFVHRYLLIALVPLLFISAVLLDMFLQQWKIAVMYPVLGVIILIQAYTFYKSTDFNDVEIGAFDAMKVQQEIVQFLESEQLYEHTITTNSYVHLKHLTDPNTGYLRSHKTFKNVQWALNDSTEIMIFDNIEPDDRRRWELTDTAFHVAFKVQKGRAWGEVFLMNKLR
jgi:4-amino-4-deoxy-L-arabinose transferase-like glycosyltransferase